MLRFVEGKYSAGLPCGVMLGYVMDGSIARAKQAVVAGLKRYAAKLALRHKPELLPCVHLPAPHAATEHTRAPSLGGCIRLHHIFLPV